MSKKPEMNFAAEIAETWLALLIGDIQIRIVTGQIQAPGDDAIKHRALTATRQVKMIYLTQQSAM